ncbi:CCA tRNA nucleotidyltransferase [Actinobacteria bacterium YIM 96077]|uniref:CCA tRNA nucleotidyltransferase n=1 Tax=Phytoactinopolyspora halophila TaxID=1981511 RepID=A0A329QRG1_9ACTN|nr:CCA tRNA nucleotidyltransferase [Phytoactinopolyspora halophila]AYY15765.1 CCA tRNA nucleotidyltransferase [Actinobacteria bacterium YIM 96077]RAW14736.1 CCA tRNA nucleotidyltransferase [Phytoactinopolyspora halophila]
MTESTNTNALSEAQRHAVRQLLRISPVVDELGVRFDTAGHEIALVGGSVRDAFLDRLGQDLDFTTSARPEETKRLLSGWADSVWDVGQAYGTIGARKGKFQVEITTYRSEIYDRSSRKPEVAYGTTIEEDLVRRDFTVNAMALKLPSREFVDPHEGLPDLGRRIIRTPGTPERSFSDDPLRMMRAARFAAQLGFDVASEVTAAVQDMADRITIVSAERVRDELSKLVLAPLPRRGLTFLVDTGLAERILPELPALQLEIDEHHRHKDVYEHSLTVLDQAIELEPRLPDGGPDLIIRLAALLHDVGKPKTRRFEPGGGVSFHHHDVVGAKLARKRLTKLRFPSSVVDSVAKLTELHLRFHGYGSGQWTDSAVRRYVRDAGDLLDHLHVLTRSDCTTRNPRKAKALQRSYDELEERIERLSEEEELAKIRPDLDGNQIMDILGIGPGPMVGRAYRHLLELRMERGPMSEDEARAELLAWWAQQSPEGD